MAGDKIWVTLPNENVDGYYRVISVEHHLRARDHTLEVTLELGKEPMLLADYLYVLRNKREVYLDTKSGESEMGSNQSYRSVLVRRELHGKLKALAAFNEVKIQDLASAILEKALQDEESVKMIIKRLKI